MRKTIHQPDDHWHYFELAAKRQKISLSEWIDQQCIKALPPKIRAKLSNRQSRGDNLADARQAIDRSTSISDETESNRRLPVGRFLRSTHSSNTHSIGSNTHSVQKAPYVLDDVPRHKEPAQPGWSDYGYNEYEPFGISAKECRILDSVKSIEAWEYTAGQCQHITRLASKYPSLPQWVHSAADVISEF